MQFSMRFKFSATVHKAQGNTLVNLVVDLRSEDFPIVLCYAYLSCVKTIQAVFSFSTPKKD